MYSIGCFFTIALIGRNIRQWLEEASPYREQMRNSLESSEVIFSGTVQLDLLS